MKEEVYDFLKEYGFDSNDLNELEEVNDNVYFLKKENVSILIKHFEENGFSKEEIINIINNNISLITLSLNEIEEYEDILLNYLDFNLDEYQSIINNINIYDIEFQVIKEIVNLLEQNGYDINKIRKLIISNPNILNIHKQKEC